MYILFFPWLPKYLYPFKPLLSTLRLKAFLHYNEFEDCKNTENAMLLKYFKSDNA